MPHRKRLLGRLPTVRDLEENALLAEWNAMAGKADLPQVQPARVLSQEEIDSLLGFGEDEMNRDSEPSMEDILASIRRILSEDEAPPPRPTLWRRLRKRLFPSHVMLERMAEQVESLAADVGRLQRRLSNVRVLTQTEIDSLLSFDDTPSPYPVRREIERVKTLLADADLRSLVDHLEALRADGKTDLLADSLLLIAVEGEAVRQELLAAAFPMEMVATAERISLGVMVSAERAAAVADALQAVLDSTFRYDAMDQVDAVAVLADAIRDPTARHRLLVSLLVAGEPRDACAAAVLERQIGFGSFVFLSDADLRSFLADSAMVPQIDRLAVALKGQPQAVRDRIAACLPAETASELSDAMESMGSVRQEEAEKAVANLVDRLRAIVRSGVIPWPTVLGINGMKDTP